MWQCVAVRDMGDAAVQVAVRVRPFNSRESKMGAERAIDMEDKSTFVYEENADDTDTEPRIFAFDYSLWSHYDFDAEPGGEVPEHPGRMNVNQEVCYDLIGRKLLHEFWDGYDVCMFAYGQSGSGKSFSMTGTGPKCAPKWKGNIPRICADTFRMADQITANSENTTIKITASMLEIYVEKIYDLLIPPEEYNINTRVGLEMQMDDVIGLTQLPVRSEDDVTDLLVRGFGNQTKAPTGLNVDSSRGHTIFTLTMDRIVENKQAKKKSERFQTIRTNMKLVDLAGSERTAKVLEITKQNLEKLLTEKYGRPKTVSDKEFEQYKAERTIEGKSINNSLTVLGNCVKQVGKISQIPSAKERAQKMTQIAWRASSLTRLLKTALNGKCKTIMIAAISPSVSELPETLSTMRYADEIKKIKSTAVKQEVKKTEEQLQAEKIKELEAKLAALLASMSGDEKPASAAEAEEDEEEPEEPEEPDEVEPTPAARAPKPPKAPKAPKESKKVYVEKKMDVGPALEAELRQLKEKAAKAEREEKLMEAKMEKLRKEAEERKRIKATLPHLLLMLDNPMTSGLLPLALPRDVGVVAGPKEQVKEGDVGLKGSTKMPHATFCNNGKVILTPFPDASAMVNGKTITQPTELKHNDRLRFGENNWFRFIDPAVLETLSTKQREHDDHEYTYEMMKEEAMEEAIKNFELGGEENTELRQAAMQKQIQKQEKELLESRRQIDELIAAEREKQTKHLEELEKKLQAESELAEAELHQASREKRRQIMETNKLREREIRKQMLEAKQQMQADMNKQQEELEGRLKEELKQHDVIKRKEEKDRRLQEGARQRLYFDIMDSLGPVRQANQYAKTMCAPTEFNIKITKVQTYGSITNAVTIEVKDVINGVTEMWTIEEFRTKYGMLVEEYTDNYGLLQRGLPAHIKPYSPFLVNPKAPQIIGHTTLSLGAIYHLMEVNDCFPVTDYQGLPCGKLLMAITIVYPNEALEEESNDVEDIADFQNLQTLDIEIDIKQCVDLPLHLSNAVRCTFGFPSWIATKLMPVDDRHKVKQETDALDKNNQSDDDKSEPSDDEDEVEAEALVERGGSYVTDWLLEVGGRVTCNPIINWKRVVRIFLTKKVREWLSDVEFVITVIGTPSDDDVAHVLHKRNQAMQDAVHSKTTALLKIEEEKMGKLDEEQKSVMDEGRKAWMQAEEEMEQAALANNAAVFEIEELGTQIEEGKRLLEKIDQGKENVKQEKQAYEKAKQARETAKGELKKSNEAIEMAQAQARQLEDERAKEERQRVQVREQIKKQLEEAETKTKLTEMKIKKAKKRAAKAEGKVEQAEKKAREAMTRELEALEEEKAVQGELERWNHQIAVLESKDQGCCGRSSACSLV